MITRNQLREIHGDELPLHILEQDYIQSLFLEELYDKVDSLVFKGGTYLKHAFGLDRFSEDLDFTIYGDFTIKMLKKAASGLDAYGVEAGIDKIKTDDISITGRLRYRGPLFNGSDKSIGNIDIEISKRDDVFLETEWKRLFFDYPETRAITVLGLQKEEIFAEKLRALATREKGRDLYDIWFLLKQDVRTNKDLFKEKMEVVDLAPKLDIKISEFEWKQDLEVLLERPPKYGEVKKEVIKSLKSKGFEIR